MAIATALPIVEGTIIVHSSAIPSAVLTIVRAVEVLLPSPKLQLYVVHFFQTLSIALDRIYSNSFLDSQNNSVPGPENGEFTFRSNRQGPRFDEWEAHTRQYKNGPRPNRARPRGLNVRGRRNDQRGRMDRGTRGVHPFTRTYDRPLLTARRETTPERLVGMANTAHRFKSYDDDSMSDKSMDLDSELEDAEADDEPSSKKIARGSVKPNDFAENVKPKWSNPDPYTSLPPPDESKGKRKDVVKMIRKAKVSQEKNAGAKPFVVEEFISFEADGDEDDEDDELKAEGAEDEDEDEKGVSSLMASEAVVESMSNEMKNSAWNEEATDQTFVFRPATNFPRYSLDENIEPREAPQQASKKRKREVGLDGSVRTEWIAKDARSAKPWLTVDLSATEDMTDWLHYEICAFYDYVTPRPFESESRHDLVRRVGKVVERMTPARVESFGSFAANLYLPTGDMDLVALSYVYLNGGQPQLGQKPNQIHKFAGFLDKAGLMFHTSKEVVTRAKVPVVKYIDRPTGLRVDISFENLTGVNAIPTFRSWSTSFPAMPMIVCIIKQFLSMRGLNELYSGGMNSFTITCLVVSLLQRHPSVQNGTMEGDLANLGDILLHFFDLYGNRFNIATTEISLNPPLWAPKVRPSSLPVDEIFLS